MQTTTRQCREAVRITSRLPPLDRLPAPTADLPCWELTFLADGRPWKCLKRARNSGAAAADALLELAYQYPEFDASRARLASAVQTR